MDLSVITMDKNDARKAFLDYRRAVRERHNAEDEQIMRGYKALANGHQLIHLTDTLRAGGTIRKEWNNRRQSGVDVLPALAIMRADQPFCWVSTPWSTTPNPAIRFAHAAYPHHNATRNVYHLRNHGLNVSSELSGWRAIVPPVPPALRPVHSLSGYHILWEAEWEKFVPPRPPGDPALLKHIGGDLYAVVAIWDLTELERAVLSGRHV